MLPVNAALNPLLYTISTRPFRRHVASSITNRAQHLRDSLLASITSSSRRRTSSSAHSTQFALPVCIVADDLSSRRNRTEPQNMTPTSRCQRNSRLDLSDSVAKNVSPGPAVFLRNQNWHSPPRRTKPIPTFKCVQTAKERRFQL
jgi:hypothetical protein